MTFQLGSALLDACVLATLNREDTYGYVLTQSVKAVVEISESTLYPVCGGCKGRLAYDVRSAVFGQAPAVLRHHRCRARGACALPFRMGHLQKQVESMLFGG